MISDNLETHMERTSCPSAKKQPLENFRQFGSLTVTRVALRSCLRLTEQAKGKGIGVCQDRVICTQIKWPHAQ